MKRWQVTGYPAKGPERRGKGVTLPAMPARVRLHLMPAGNPLETSDLEVLRALMGDLERATGWLEEQQLALEAELLAEAIARPLEATPPEPLEEEAARATRDAYARLRDNPARQALAKRVAEAAAAAGFELEEAGGG